MKYIEILTGAELMTHTVDNIAIGLRLVLNILYKCALVEIMLTHFNLTECNKKGNKFKF